MTMGAATTIGAADRCRCAAGLYPCLFIGTCFDLKKTLVVHSIVFLSHPLDHSVSQINRITRHIVPPGGEPYASFLLTTVLCSSCCADSVGVCCLILNNSKNNYCQNRYTIIELVNSQRPDPAPTLGFGLLD